VKTGLAADGLRVSVDHDRCSGTGYCQESLPALFAVQDRRAWLREDFDLATAGRDDLEDAAAACPWFAITVEEQ
jgi:ferredoxin